MNTNELFDLIRIKKRMCNSTGGCQNCPLHFATCRFDYCDDFDDLDYLIRTVKEWDAAHPALEEVGKGIYYDPKNRIVPDELTREITVVLTFNNCVSELTKEDLGWWKNGIVTALKWNIDADDIHAVDVQQFITKCHEEEI